MGVTNKALALAERRKQARTLATLRGLIAASKKSDRQFAMTVLHVNERTLRRWLAGAFIPEHKAAFINGLDSSFRDALKSMRGDEA